MLTGCLPNERIDSSGNGDSGCWVTRGVEQMLSWIERKKQPTFRSEHKSVWKATWERLVQTPSGRVKLRPSTPCLVRCGSRYSQ